MEKNLSLFGKITEEKTEIVNLEKEKTLFITLNGERRDLKIEEIFDVSKYNKIKAVTYSVDESFINNYFSGFSEVELIIGIPDSKVQARGYNAIKNILNFNNQISKEEQMNFFEKLSRKNQNHIMERKWKLKVPFKVSIHSKFYLLEGKNEETRLIVGSANLSNQAFSEKSNQFENIMIFDNSEIFSEYSRHFDILSSSCIDFITSALIGKAKENLKIISKNSSTSEKEEAIAIIFDTESRGKLETELFTEHLEKVSEYFQELDPEELANKKNIMKELKENYLEQVEKELKDIKEEEKIYEITEVMLNKQASVAKNLIVKPETFVKRLQKISISIAPKLKEGVMERKRVILKENDMGNNNSGLYLIEKENVENKRAVHFGQKATNEEIKEGIKNIEKLIENYRKYVPNYTEEYGSRVLEIIFYCFTAPYIQQIRSCFKSTDSKEGISPFLFIGGTPFSGKTKLLNLIVYRMIGIEKKKRGEKETVSTYSSIVPKNSKWRANTIDQLDYWLREDNVYPIFVDELDKDFFANPERSDKLVTNLVNDTGFHGKSGCLIGTTNSNSFEMPKRSARRSYYIKIDKVFDEKRFSECNREYNKILNKTNNKLFKDFVVRMAEELSKENVKLDNYSKTSNSEKIDFLFLTRKIFREYFEIADIKIPKWFPQNRYNDISEQNMEKWKSCYQMLPEKFKVIEEDGKKIYGFNLRELNVDKNTKENVSYYEAMANQCIIVNSDQYLKFDIEKFHEWIGIPVPKELRKKKNIFNFFKKI